jgi:hypothetical protein
VVYLQLRVFHGDRLSPGHRLDAWWICWRDSQRMCLKFRLYVASSSKAHHELAVRILSGCAPVSPLAWTLFAFSNVCFGRSINSVYCPETWYTSIVDPDRCGSESDEGLIGNIWEDTIMFWGACPSRARHYPQSVEELRLCTNTDYRAWAARTVGMYGVIYGRCQLMNPPRLFIPFPLIHH